MDKSKLILWSNISIGYLTLDRKLSPKERAYGYWYCYNNKKYFYK